MNPPDTPMSTCLTPGNAGVTTPVRPISASQHQVKRNLEFSTIHVSKVCAVNIVLFWLLATGTALFTLHNNLPIVQSGRQGCMCVYFPDWRSAYCAVL